jgi:hypothetical protein
VEQLHTKVTKPSTLRLMHGNVPNKSGCVEIGKDLPEYPQYQSATLPSQSSPCLFPRVGERCQCVGSPPLLLYRTSSWGGMALPKLEEGLFGSTSEVLERRHKVVGHHL